MSEHMCGSAFSPFACCNPPRKLTSLRKAASGSVDLPNSKSVPSFVGNQLHSDIPCFGFGSDMPFAVYMAQKRRGFWLATSLPIASSNGNAKVTPASPFKTERRFSLIREDMKLAYFF